ncbi:MAG: peptidase domain-containing ABC transporter [Rudaea sp.]|uniref:peptidase domain-containing ABC transporter n=1 Tax=Rudaea sp. TaxID=2136325 RepID=UPI0039E55FF6
MAVGASFWFCAQRGGTHLISRRLPLLVQTEAAECGLACLAMIARYFGHEIDLPSMRRRFSTSARGVTLAKIIADAHTLGFDARPLRVELEYLPQLSTPCILHWNLNHFVVLKRATEKYVEIHDPASGYQKLSMQQASKHVTGIALELLPAANFKPVKEQQSIPLRALVGNVEGLRGAALHILLLALALELFALVLPFYLQTVLDQVLVTSDRQLLGLLGAGFLGVITLRAGLTAARGWAISWLAARLNAQWLGNLFAHLLRLPMEWFEKRHVGDITSRFASVQSIQHALTGSFVESILDGVMGSLALALLCIYSPPLTELMLLGLAAYALCRHLAYPRLWRANEDQIVFAARQQTSLLEAIRGAQTIKLANKQSDRAARFANISLHAAQYGLAAQRIGYAFGALNLWSFGVLRVVIIWLGALQVLNGNFSAGMLVAFVAYTDELITRFSGLIDKFVELRLLRLHALRIGDIALTAPEILGFGGQSDIASFDIEVDDVSFRYSADEPWVIKNYSLRVSAGESIAIVGPSGCGKTTLAKIILGLLKPVEGTVRIGGLDIRQFGLQRYRAMIGSVMQDDQLFEGSIAENISFFDAEATPQRIEEAARLAAIHADINAMPMGYETWIGNMGSTLSGGQKQRVILARALYANPRILLLDEATSHLDIERERAINASVAHLNITRIVITHRAESIASAGRVVRFGAESVLPIRTAGTKPNPELAIAAGD